MIVSAAVYLAVTLAFGYAAPLLAVRLHPSAAVRLIVPAALAIVCAGGFVLALTAMTWIGQHPEVAELGEWSPDRLAASNPVPRLLAALSAGLLVAAAVSVLTTVARRLRAFAGVRRATATLLPAGRVVLVDDVRPDAFSTPAPGGRIVVTTGMLRALAGQERRALMAHEASHLSHRHAWWLFAVDVAAAANPALRRTARTLAHVVERWADEDAADHVNDRRLVARTIARAALLTKHHHAAPALAPAASGGDIPARVTALLAPRPPRGRMPTAILAVILAFAATATVAMDHNADELFDGAGRLAPTAPGQRTPPCASSSVRDHGPARRA